MKKNHYLLIVMLFLSISHVWAWDGDTDLTIKDATEFKAFIEASTNNNFAGKTIVLTNNIDFANETIIQFVNSTEYLMEKDILFQTFQSMTKK